MAEPVSFFTNFITAMNNSQDRKRQTALDTARLVMEQNNFKLEQKRLDSQVGQQTAILDLKQQTLADQEGWHKAHEADVATAEADRKAYNEDRAKTAQEIAGIRGDLARSTEALNALKGDESKARTKTLTATIGRIEADTRERKERTRLVKAEADIAAKKVNYTDLSQKLALAKTTAQIHEINQSAALKAKQLQLVDPQIHALNALTDMRNASAALDKAKTGAVGKTVKHAAWNTIATGARTSKEAVDRAQKKADDLQTKILNLENGINSAQMANAGVDTDYDHLMLHDAHGNNSNITVTSAMNTIKGYTDPRTGKKVPGLQDQLENALRGLSQVQSYHDDWQTLYNQYAGESIQTTSGKNIKTAPYKAPPAQRTPHVERAPRRTLPSLPGISGQRSPARSSSAAPRRHAPVLSGDGYTLTPK